MLGGGAYDLGIAKSAGNRKAKFQLLIASKFIFCHMLSAEVGDQVRSRALPGLRTAASTLGLHRSLTPGVARRALPTAC